MDNDSIEEFYNNLMNDMEQKLHSVPDIDIIQKITLLFNQIKQKRKHIELLEQYIKRCDIYIKNIKIPFHISNKIKLGKNKLVKVVKECTEILSKIEKEDYAKNIVLTNIFSHIIPIPDISIEKNIYSKLQDEIPIKEEELEELEGLFNDLDFWVNLEQWDYVEQCVNRFNGDDNTVSFFHIPSPLEIYYNYCKIS